MGIQVALRHRTCYKYDKPVILGPQVIRLRPGLHCRTPILSYLLEVTPIEHSLSWQLDPSSNQQARVLFPTRTSEFTVEVTLVVDLFPINPFDFLLDPTAEEYPFHYVPEVARDLQPYLTVDPPGPLLRGFISGLDQRTSTVNLLLLLNRKVRDEIGYVSRLEHGIQSAEESLQKHSGSCRDSAWLLIECLRNLGIAGRFVSGYLIQLGGDEKTGLVGAKNSPQSDSADLHAWAEAFLPGAGWIGLDPTSGLLACEGHIPLACSSSRGQVAPISGTAERESFDFSYEMSVRRLDDRRP